MGKSSSPSTPDYSATAAASEQSSAEQYSLGMSQLDWSKQQFNSEWPYAQEYMQQQTASSAAATSQAEKAQSYYDQTYQPIETQFAQTALNYNSPSNASQKAGSAMADVASTFDANRASSLSNLESYGIDPSQTRYGALDLGTRISQAAATAAAGTQSRLNTENTGLALQSEAINTGRGYANTIAGDYSTATNTGSSGISSANQTTQTASNTSGTPSSYFSGSTAANNSTVNALNTSYSNALSGSEFQANQSSSFSSGVGSLLGTAIVVGGIAV